MSRQKKKKIKIKFDKTLKELRKELGLTQKAIKNFEQASVSKIESRKDLKLSTLIEYLHCLGLELEIKAILDDPSANGQRDFILLKTKKDEIKKSEKQK